MGFGFCANEKFITKSATTNSGKAFNGITFTMWLVFGIFFIVVMLKHEASATYHLLSLPKRLHWRRWGYVNILLSSPADSSLRSE